MNAAKGRVLLGPLPQEWLSIHLMVKGVIGHISKNAAVNRALALDMHNPIRRPNSHDQHPRYQLKIVDTDTTRLWYFHYR